MIVTVGNTKGGVGKTTLALNLAIVRARAGRDVWLIDGDRQGTAQIAVSIRAEAGSARHCMRHLSRLSHFAHPGAAAGGEIR